MRSRGDRDRLWGRVARHGRCFGPLAVLAVIVTSLGCGTATAIAAGTTTRVSVASDGSQGTDLSYNPSVSGDGRFVAFWSTASNLVPGDTNGRSDVFVHERATGVTTRVSVASDGSQGGGGSSGGTTGSFAPSISADGRFVAFFSYDSNLVSGDTNSVPDIFVHDRTTGTTTRVSVATDGSQSGSLSGGHSPSISADGRFVAFSSSAPEFIPNDTNGVGDVFIHDLKTGTTSRVSIASDGSQANGSSGHPSVSADGHFVSFRSDATDLVSGDTNNATDIFVHDRVNGTTTRVSVASGGAQGGGAGPVSSISGDGQLVAFCAGVGIATSDTNAKDDVFVHDRASGRTARISDAFTGAESTGHSVHPSISSDGRSVAFYSEAPDLVPGDTNGKLDVFVYDRETGTTTRVSVASDDTQGSGESGDSLPPSISAEGRLVAFNSLATNLVPDDTNDASDVFVHERAADGAGIPYPPSSATPATSGSKPAIVLVGGINEEYGFKSPDDVTHPWHDAYAYLKYQRGYDVYVVPSLKNSGAPRVVDSLDGYTGDNAERVQRYLVGEGLNNREVIIIGHSMGGLIARKWAGSPWVWRSSQLSPAAIIQLGTPNAGSPLPALDRIIRRWTYDRTFSQSTFELDEKELTIAHFNEQFSNPDDRIPILKLGGNYFPSVSASLHAAGSMAHNAIYNSLMTAFRFKPNDGAVSIDSLLAGPKARESDTYSVMHSSATGLNWFFGGFIVPMRDSDSEDQILDRIGSFCDDVSSGPIQTASLAALKTTAVQRSVASSSGRALAALPPSESGDAFTSIIGESLSLSAGVTSTVDFSVEGTSALAQIACADSGLKIAVRGVSGVVSTESQLTSEGVLVAFPATAGGSYSLDLRSASTTSAAVSILDGGPTVLVVDTQASGAGGSDVLVSALLKRDSSYLAGSLVARADNGSDVAMSDDGSGADATASDGVYSASVHLPDNGMAARVTVDASATGGIQRTGFGLTEIVEPRATISGAPTLSLGLTSSGKVGQVLVDVPIEASMDCTVQVAADMGQASGLIAQSMSQETIGSGSSSVVRVTFDAEDLGALSDDATAVVASIKLYDSTDGGLSLLDSATSASISLARTELALAACSIDPFGKPVNADPVLITGAASCTSETISGIDISLDGGNEWLVVPEPASGWGSNETTWSCAFTLSDGEYGASVRLRGANGLIDGATDSLVFSVDRTGPTGTMAIADGAQFATPSFSIDSSVTSATEMRVRASTNGTTWGSWTGWDAYDASIDMGVGGASQKWWYQLEYRDDAGNVLTLTDDVMVDATGPVTTSDAKATYVTSAAIKLVATDTGSGVAATHYKLDGVQGTGTAVSALALGSHTLEFWSVDDVGNMGAHQTVSFSVTAPVPVDATAPVTTSDAVATYVASATIKLTATDAGSGVASTFYRLDGGAQTAGTTISTVVGSHTLEFWSVDVAGNAEVHTTVAFTVKAKTKASVGTPRAPSKMSHSKSYAVYGYLKPRHTRGTYPVRIYRWKKSSSGSWKRYGDPVKAKASDYSSNGQLYSKYSVKMRLAKAGKWRLRAYAPADSGHVATWSSGYDYVTVK